LIKTNNFGQNAVNKGQLKTKMNNIVQLGCLFSKLPRLFVNFLSMLVSIFYRVLTQLPIGINLQEWDDETNL
jgi:hypothetical protein